MQVPFVCAELLNKKIESAFSAAGSRSIPALPTFVFSFPLMCLLREIRTYSLVPKESNVTLVPHITLIRPNTLSLKGAITLFWVNTKRKTVMTLIRIVLLSNGCAVITLFRIYLKRVMTDPFTFGCHYSLLDHVKLKLQS